LDTEQRIAALEAYAQKHTAEISVLTAAFMMAVFQELSVEKLSLLRERLIADLLPTPQPEASLDGINEQIETLIDYVKRLSPNKPTA
jgi:hypothetical protein